MATIDDESAGTPRTAPAAQEPSPPAPSPSPPSRSGNDVSDVATSTPPASKGKRRAWSTDQDVLALKAILTSSAHVAPRGQRLKRFEDAADAFNKHPQAAFKTSGKNLLDHFATISSQFSREDKKKARRTGEEEDTSERDKLLADMVDAAEALRAQEEAAKGAAAEKEKKLEADGLAVRELAMERRRRKLKEGTNDDEDVEEAQSTSAPTRGKKRRYREHDDTDDGDILEVLERSERRREIREEKQMAQMEKRLEEQRQAQRDEQQKREAADRAREERQERKDEMFLSVLAAIARKLE